MYSPLSVWHVQEVVVSGCGVGVVDGGGSSACRTWLEHLTALLNRSSSASSHSSSYDGRSAGQYP